MLIPAGVKARKLDQGKKIYYRCTKAKGKCSQSYTSEEDLEPQLFDIFQNIKLDKKDIKNIQSELIKLYEKDQIFQEKTLKTLRTELTRLEDQKRKLYEKMLLGDLDKETQEMATELRSDLDHKISTIHEKIDTLAGSSYSWLEQSSNPLKLVSEAKELFSLANKDQKAQLINFVSSNPVLRDKKVLYDYIKPFNLAVKIKSAQIEKPEKNSDCPIWLGGRDSNPDSLDQNQVSYH